MTTVQRVATGVVTTMLVLMLVLGIQTGALTSRIDLDALAGGGGPGTTRPGGGTGTGGPDADRPDPGVFDHGTGAPGIFTAAPGDCMVDSSAGGIVSCDHPHRAEVFYTYMADGDDFPGEDGFDENRCLEMFGAYVGTTPDASGFGITWLVPSRSTWESSGDREIICLLVSDDLRTGSAFGSAQLVA